MKIPSQAYLIAAAVLAPAIFVGRLLGGMPSALAFLASGFVITGFAFGILFAAIRLNDLSRRPSRFSLSPKGFHTRPAIPPGVLVLIVSVGVADMLGSALERNREGRAGGTFLVIASVILVLTAGAVAVFAIGRGHVDLTREGIGWGRGPFRRAVGWDELAPGGPLRAHPGERKLRLETRGGARSISTQVDVNPWFLADAIRWYVEHPEHRGGIGTQAEHDRLTAGLGVAA